MTDACLVYVTAPDADSARTIAEAVVRERLAACANIHGEMTSIFHWEGALAHERETPILLKTARDRLEALTARVTALHPYEEPCVIALPIIGGATSFIEWIETETRAG